MLTAAVVHYATSSSKRKRAVAYAIDGVVMLGLAAVLIVTPNLGAYTLRHVARSLLFWRWRQGKASGPAPPARCEFLCVTTPRTIEPGVVRTGPLGVGNYVKLRPRPCRIAPREGTVVEPWNGLLAWRHARRLSLLASSSGGSHTWIPTVVLPRGLARGRPRRLQNGGVQSPSMKRQQGAPRRPPCCPTEAWLPIQGEDLMSAVKPDTHPCRQGGLITLADRRWHRPGSGP